jgi:hypothetical protein
MSLGDTASLVTLLHDWSEPVERVRHFPTILIDRRDGSEQRQGLSHLGTDTLTYRLIAPDSTIAQVLPPLIELATDTIVRVPRWEDQARVTTAISAGVSTVPCDPTDKPTFVADAQVILWRSPELYEVAVIDTVGGSSIDTVDPTTLDWGAGTIVAPITAARVVLPLSLTHWGTATTGAQSFVVECSLADLAGVGTGGTGTTGTPDAIVVSDPVSVPPYGRAAFIATVTDAAGNILPGDGIVWTSSDVPNAPVYATSDPGIALVSNPNGLFFSPTATITATLGALTDSGTARLGW